jgi:type II secretory ATPase GspE/PulE/Tfp pilus assembly ATPase PilB-like protein
MKEQPFTAVTTGTTTTMEEAIARAKIQEALGGRIISIEDTVEIKISELRCYSAPS